MLDSREFEDAVLVHVPAMRRFAASRGAGQDADDVVQDALARAWRRRSTFDPDRGSTRVWLMSFVAGEARARWRRLREPVAYDLRLSSPSFEEPNEVTTDVRAVIATLPRRQRTAIILRHYVDLEYAEIAVLMGCSVGTVRSTLHDARKALRTRLGAIYVAE
ncbi:RNA polymerase sigma factor [uncultured Jatrophihabitans sp.]|uniref:RNA polymerase sigma factor n=1 Tax=uncultured Jatrophihabitans sp. TaxID=1610747 RepID=UPI0035CC295A